MTNRFELGYLLITTPPEWKDITDTVDADSAPFTIAKDDGVGALQFSSAEYRSGDLPAFTLSDLCVMRDEFGANHGFSNALDKTACKGATMVAGASYHVNQDFVRVWYCSNGKDIVLATYTSEWSHRSNEIHECDEIVSELKFRREN
jgi:hypothetical protein